MNKKTIGILAEKKSGEFRIPLPPFFVQELNTSSDYNIVVEPSETRCFKNSEFTEKGITVDSIPSEADVILSVKEIPIKRLEANKTYMYFSHTIKGQDYNMSMLQHILDKNITLIDYEMIRNQEGRRLVFFGRYAGIAGMINSLWTYGLKLQSEGVVSPFLELKQARDYCDYPSAIEAIKALKDEVHSFANSLDIPLVVGFAGYGNVSKGAQEVYDLLEPNEISPAESLIITKPGLYKVIFKEEDSVQPNNESDTFELQDYYDNPEKYKSVFAKFLPFMSILVNCIYWTEKYPRLITKTEIANLYSKENVRLKTIGDVSCDIDGGIEVTLLATVSDEPIFNYNPTTEKAEMGVEGNGPAMMTVDNLPAELPREASIGFGELLQPYMDSLFTCDFTKDFDDLELVPEIKGAIIAHKGQFVPEFKYLTEFLNN